MDVGVSTGDRCRAKIPEDVGLGFWVLTWAQLGMGVDGLIGGSYGWGGGSGSRRENVGMESGIKGGFREETASGKVLLADTMRDSRRRMGHARDIGAVDDNEVCAALLRPWGESGGPAVKRDDFQRSIGAISSRYVLTGDE
ncbi:hypothetical protein KM043_013674 [Ampulex compressa]|nr:hypothetical protein KM043_013674 [Ampulex compressa]